MIKSLTNSWLFGQRGWNDLWLVESRMNSIATFETEEAEKAVTEWVRNHRRLPLNEWSDLADPFEPAGQSDWNPVRSVRLATAGKRPTDPAYVEWLAARRRAKREAVC